MAADAAAAGLVPGLDNYDPGLGLQVRPVRISGLAPGWTSMALGLVGMGSHTG